MAIDISDRLGAALLPFGILVVGLSLVLLTMVFRSVAVPLKATIGYLLSVGAAFGVTTMVFEYNWLGSLLNVAEPAPVISFLPILLMGILFGLAMDYEVFLVSRIREEYVHARDSVSKGDDPLGPPPRDARARQAIEDGFAASSRVVVAAAVIMFAVFAAFVPEGEGADQAHRLGLAVGVFVDAFIVRMTLVPAVLSLLGERPGGCRGWIDRTCPPSTSRVRVWCTRSRWPTGRLRTTGIWSTPRVWPSATRHRRRGGGAARRVVVVDGTAGSGKTALLLTLPAGCGSTAGRAKMAGLVLPEQAGRRTPADRLPRLRPAPDLRRELRVLPASADVMFIDNADVLTSHDDRAALASLVDDLAVAGADQAVVVAVRDRALIADLLPAPTPPSRWRASTTWSRFPTPDPPCSPYDLTP